MAIPTSARFLNLHPDHTKVVGSDQLGVVVNPSGAIQVGTGVGLELKPTIPTAHTFSLIPSCAITPSSGNHLVNKSYVDGLVYGLSWKDAVVARTTGNVSLTGLLTVDGYSVQNGERVLVSEQSVSYDDGIYIASTGTWVRASDCPSGESIGGITVRVRNGTTHGDKTYSVTNEGLVGTDGWTLAEIGGGTTYSAGNGLNLSTNTFSVVAADTSITVSGSGIQVNLATGSGLAVSSGLKIDIPGQTSTGSAAGSDELLIHNGSALRRITKTNFLAGVTAGSTKFAEYTITGSDVTAKQATITGVAGNVGSNNLVFLNGHLLESGDATLTPGTGVLAWTGLSLDGRIAAGDKVVVWGHT